MNYLDVDFEVKFLSNSADAMTFAGYAAVFGNVDGYGDIIQKGAFKESIRAAKKANRWPAMLLQHGGITSEDLMPIGIWTSMEEDDTGLLVEGKLADTDRGREVYSLLKMQPRPALNGLSIGYIPREWSMGSEPGQARRTLKKVDLIEVSLVTFPANELARIQSVKSDLTIRDAERALRDAGFSRSEAKAILARGYGALSLRDADEIEQLACAIRRNISLFIGGNDGTE